MLNDKSRMKGDLHVRFREKFEVKVLLLTRLRGERKSPLLDPERGMPMDKIIIALLGAAAVIVQQIFRDDD